MKTRCAIYLGIVFMTMSRRVSAQGDIDPEQAARLRKEAARADMQREELLNLQKETVRAIQTHSTAFFNRVYSDDFLGTSPAGVNLNKAALVAAVQNSPVNYSSFVATDIQVRVFQNTAVTMCLWSSRGTYQGSPFFRQSRVTHV